ncbi:MAG: STAS domain-containing protein [Lachnospiraceae bacterium]|nr:STAS domain-containing protein [Lachnospiraceae bacterium]
MNIKKEQNGTELKISLEGRLDTTTAPELESELKASLDGISELSFDFESLEYVSSAGLRVLLAAQKTMNRQGKMVIKNVKPEIMEIFEVTGFVDILTIEE